MKTSPTRTVTFFHLRILKIKIHQANYSEKLLVGYRYYDAKGVTPAFPFGHGLSYTTFALSNLAVSASRVSVDVANTGKVSGASTPMLLPSLPSAPP